MFVWEFALKIQNSWQWWKSNADTRAHNVLSACHNCVEYMNEDCFSYCWVLSMHFPWISTKTSVFVLHWTIEMKHYCKSASDEYIVSHWNENDACLRSLSCKRYGSDEAMKWNFIINATNYFPLIIIQSNLLCNDHAFMKIILFGVLFPPSCSFTHSICHIFGMYQKIPLRIAATGAIYTLSLQSLQKLQSIYPKQNE